MPRRTPLPWHERVLLLCALSGRAIAAGEPALLILEPTLAGAQPRTLPAPHGAPAPVLRPLQGRWPRRFGARRAAAPPRSYSNSTRAPSAWPPPGRRSPRGCSCRRRKAASRGAGSGSSAPGVRPPGTPSPM